MVIAWTRVPRSRALAAAVLVHVLVFVIALPFLQESKVRLVQPKEKVVEFARRNAPIVYNSAGSRKRSSGVPMHASKAIAHAKLMVPAGKGEPSLGERARRATKQLMANFQFSLNYGFNPGTFSFASRTHGELPRIEAHEVSYEQYVIIEATIDVDGTVAEARVVTGKVPSQVAEKLISAVREFRYDPAKRDGVAVPSLVDIVVHVPS
jgi:hypothetical protein